jgi:hypothetical protein
LKEAVLNLRLLFDAEQDDRLMDDRLMKLVEPRRCVLQPLESSKIESVVVQGLLDFAEGLGNIFRPLPNRKLLFLEGLF